MRTKKPLAFASWEPDKGKASGTALNAKGVIWKAGRYAPLPSLAVYKAGTAHNDFVIGANTFYDQTGSPFTFTADQGRLYRMTDKSPVDVSPLAGVSFDSDWQVTFVQFNNFVFAFGRGPRPLVYEMGASARFETVASAPFCDTGFRVRDHLFGCQGLNIAWSKFNNPTDWDVTDFSAQAGSFARGQEQGLTVGGIGGETGAIFRERGIIRVTYQGGQVPWIFDDVEGGRGACSPDSIEAYGKGALVCGEDGFYFWNGLECEPIGQDKVDQTFTRMLNYPYRARITSAYDPGTKCWMVGVPTGTSTIPNYQFIFHVPSGKWTYDEFDCQYLFTLPREGVSADDEAAIVALAGAAEENASELANISVDSPIWGDSRRAWAAVGTDRQVQTFTGRNRKAVIETGQIEPNPPGQTYVSELWPVTDAEPGTSQVSVYAKQRMGEVATLSDSSGVNDYGCADVRAEGRFLRFGLEIAAGTAWTEAVGMHADMGPAGER